MRQMLGIAAAVGLFAFSAAAAAEMTKEEYRAGRARILEEYQAARQRCGPTPGNPTQICVAQARGAQSVAKAELEAAYRPSPRAYYKAAVARAEADHSVAKQKCDALEHDARQGCMQEADDARRLAKSQAASAKKVP